MAKGGTMKRPFLVLTALMILTNWAAADYLLIKIDYDQIPFAKLREVEKTPGAEYTQFDLQREPPGTGQVDLRHFRIQEGLRPRWQAGPGKRDRPISILGLPRKKRMTQRTKKIPRSPQGDEGPPKDSKDLQGPEDTAGSAHPVGRRAGAKNRRAKRSSRSFPP